MQNNVIGFDEVEINLIKDILDAFVAESYMNVQDPEEGIGRDITLEEKFYIMNTTNAVQNISIKLGMMLNSK